VNLYHECKQFLKALGSNVGKSIMDENSSWKEDLLWLLEISFFYGSHSLRFSRDKHTIFYLEETWVSQNNLRNTLGRTHGEMENWKFLQDEASLLFVMQDQQKQALFQTAS
jgi:hypothetical protein